MIGKFVDRLGLDRYAIYMQDFGGPVGFRLAVRHPERVSALVVQNANAYEEGLPDSFWGAVRDMWRDPSSANRAKIADAARFAEQGVLIFHGEADDFVQHKYGRELDAHARGAPAFRRHDRAGDHRLRDHPRQRRAAAGLDVHRRPGDGAGRGILSTFNGENDSLLIENNEISGWTSGIFKAAVDGRVHLASEHLAGDGQAEEGLGEDVDLIFRFTDENTDAPITDLEKYLGAFGHLVILTEDMTEYAPLTLSQYRNLSAIDNLMDVASLTPGAASPASWCRPCLACTSRASCR